MTTDVPDTSLTNFVARAWSGALPLWQTFWLGLVLVSFALAGLLRVAVTELLFPLSVKNALLVFFLLALPILTFLWVAVWRSSAQSRFLPRSAARAVVMFHAGWYVWKFVRYLTMYGSLA